MQPADPIDTTLPFEATTAPAGSLQKIEMLARRRQLRLPLWHRDDNWQLATPEQEQAALNRFHAKE